MVERSAIFFASLYINISALELSSKVFHILFSIYPGALVYLLRAEMYSNLPWSGWIYQEKRASTLFLHCIHLGALARSRILVKSKHEISLNSGESASTIPYVTTEPVAALSFDRVSEFREVLFVIL